MSHRSQAAEIRARAGHPIVDVDGHILEMLPAVFPYLREALGPRLFEDYRKQGPILKKGLQRPADADQLRSRTPQTAWWGTTSDDALERATIMLPGLLHERMDDLGFDYCVLYTTNALSQCSIADHDLRVGVCRGFNDYYANVYGPFSDRMTVAGLIPMHTPEEAIAEIDHCKAIGLKVIGLPEAVLREIPEPSDLPNPAFWPGQRHWIDRFGLESAHDYDPVWQRAREHGFAVTFHGQLANLPGVYSSPNNYCYNHIGMFASLMAPLAKSLFMGGVTKRMAGQPFGFLECGVSWGAQMLADALEHWEKRNLGALARLDPAQLDYDALDDYVKRFGGELALVPDAERRRHYENEAIDASGPDQHDEWIHLGDVSAEEFCSLFTRDFYFGCEADDRGVATAFAQTNPFGAKLKAMFSSDIGHWDVERHEGVVPEAWGLVGKGVVDEEQFRDFAFVHAAEMLTAANPDFFEGTALESEARALRSAKDGSRAVTDRIS